MFMLMAMIMSISGWSQQTVTVGTGTETQDYVPTYTYYGNSATQTIYLADEIGMGGEISSISYYSTNNSTTRNVVVYMGETSLSSFSSVADAITDLTQVYSGSITFTANGWTTITFATPFVYSGTNNLVVGVRDITGSYDDYGSYPSWRSTSVAGRSIYAYQDGNPIEFSGMTDPYSHDVSNYHPNIQLTITPIEGDFCYAPGAITVSNVTSESATLSWTLNEDESSIILQYTTTDDEDWEEATEMNLSDLTTELTGLTPNTYYKVRIQSDCGTNQSSWKNAIFHTECVAFEEFPYTQGFEGTVDCWTLEQVSGTAGWGVTSYNYHNGERCVSMPYTPGAVSRLISPLFDISSLTNPYLTFFYHIEDYLGTTDYFDVYYRTEDSEDWTQLGSTYNTATEDFEYAALALPEGTIQISFLGHGNNGNNLFIDDVTIENISCEAPTAVTLSEITGHTVEIAWEGDADVISYQAEDAEEWESVTVSESPYTLEGLDGLTTYSLRVGYTCEDQTISFAPIVTFETDVTCPAPEISLTDATTNSATVTWTGEAESYVLSLKNAITNEYVEGVEELEVTANEYTFEDLEESTSYTLTIEANCGEEDGESEESTLTFTTLQSAAELPYATDFSGDEETGDVAWLFKNGSYSNYWTIGALGEGYGMFVTNDGTTSGYTVSSASSIVAVEKVFTTGSEGQVHIEFDVKVGGEGTYTPYDYLKVFVSPAIWSYEDESNSYSNSYSTNAFDFSDYLSQTGESSYPYKLSLTQGNTIHISKDVFNPNPEGEIKVTFLWRNDNSGGTQPAAEITNFSISAVQCSGPVVTVGELTSSTASITMTPEEGNYVAYYKLASDPDEEDSWIEATVSGNAIDLEELSPATIYDVKVATICGDEYSTFTNVTFVTACAELTAEDLPKTWDFESGNTGGTSSYPLPACWDRITASSSSDYPYVYNTTSYAHSGSKALYTYTYYGTAYSVLPVLSEDVEINSLQLSFYALTSSTYYDDELQVGVMTDPADASTFTLVGSTGTLTTTNTLYEFSLAEYEGEGKYVAIRNMANDSYTYASLYVDDVTLGPLPECSRPIVSNVVATEDQVAITWTSTGTEFEVYLKEATATEYGEPITANIAAVEDQENVWSITIEDLTSSTPYTFYVNALCGEDGLASVENTFRTECVAMVVTNEDPFTENFETLTSSDFGCWTEEAVSGSSHWTISTYNGSKVAYRTYNEGSNRLISPVLDLSGVSSPYLTYNWEAHNDDSYNDSIYVYYRTSAEGEWVELAAHGPNESSSISAITQINTVALPEANETYQIAFLGVGHGGYGMAIDNVIIQNVECAAPSNVVVANITQNSAEITWAGEGDVIAYKANADEDWTEVLGVTESPYALENLTTLTTYTVKVGLDCGTSISWSAERVFTTLMDAVDLPYATNFSGDEQTGDIAWFFNNHTSQNYWTIGSIGTESYGMFVTTDGTTPGYNTGETTRVSAEKIFNTGSESQLHVEFDVNVGGEGTYSPYDYLKVFITPGSWSFPASSSESNYSSYSYAGAASENIYVMDFSDYLSQTGSSSYPYKLCLTQGNTLHISADVVNPNPEGAVRLTFMWRNDNSTGTQPAATISNFSISAVTCSSPLNVVVANVTGHTAEVSWVGDATVVEYKTATDEEWSSTPATESPVTLTGLTPETSYTVRVGLECGEETAYSSNKTFTTDIACPAPMITAVETMADQATLSWTGDAESYTVSYGPNGTDVETWETITATENTVTLQNLASSTLYNVSIVANCGTEDGTSTAGVTSFRTACSVIVLDNNTTYNEGFESGDLGCWTSQTVSGVDWNIRTTYSGTTVYEGSHFVAVPNGYGNSAFLISPIFDMSSVTNPTLTFAHIQKIWGSDQDTLGLYYRTSAEGEWTYITSWTNNIPTWTVETIALPEPSATYQIMFLGYSDYGYGAGVDAISIANDDTPEPVQPTVVTLAATDIAQTTATLNGSITDAGNQTIIAQGFEWRVTSATGYNTYEVLDQFVANLTGLTANTSYTYRAFATTALGTVYGQELTFTTLAEGTVPCTPVEMTITETVCYGETYTFNGQTYNTTGIYTTTVAGQGTDCDTNYTINLTVLPQNTASETITVCAGETATFNGQTLVAGVNTITVSGQGTDCDTLYTVTLIVKPVLTENVDATICAGETYEFNGQTYNATGTYTATITGSNGCDSTITLNLTVRPANTPINDEVTLNNDELPYTYHGQEFNAFGTYTVTGEDEFGCPQEYTLTLVHNSGINEVGSEFVVTLYPNPTTSNATLLVKGLTEDATIMVTDQAGRVISTTTLALGQETMEVETSKLASGVYYVRIQTANSVRTEKLIKK